MFVSVFVGELAAKEGINGEKGKISFFRAADSPTSSCYCCMNGSAPASPDGHTTATPTIVFRFLGFCEASTKSKGSIANPQWVFDIITHLTDELVFCNATFSFPFENCGSPIIVMSLTVVIIAAICPRFNELSIFIN